jgi:hypothetical protein
MQPVLSSMQGKFHLVPYESGRYKFCLTLAHERANSRYVLSRDVVWDLHVGELALGGLWSGAVWQRAAFPRFAGTHILLGVSAWSQVPRCNPDVS